MPSSRHIPVSPRSTTPLASSVSSSPRKAITTDAKVFGGLQSSNLSISGTAVQKSTFGLAGNRAAFSAMRGAGRSRMDDDDEEEEENGHFRSASSDGQTIQLKEDAISFDQASFKSLQCSLWWLILSAGSAYSDAKCLAHGACLKGSPVLKTVL